MNKARILTEEIYADEIDAMNTALKYRRYVLIVDDGTIQKALGDAELCELLRKKDIALTLVSAKDGAQASLKAVNQKFDAIILDTSVPRMVESGFATNFRSVKNTKDGHLYVVSSQTMDQLPESLKTGRVFLKPYDAQELILALTQDLGGEEISEAVRCYSVDVRVINAIISATLKVLGQFDVGKITMGKPEMKSCQEPMGGVISSVIDIISQNFKGQLGISFDKPSYLQVVSSMLMEEQADITPDNQDAVGEINNIIYGNAKSDLAQFGVAMSIPKVVHGAGQTMACPEGSAAMRVPFTTEKGVFYIEVVAYPQ